MIDLARYEGVKVVKVVVRVFLRVSSYTLDPTSHTNISNTFVCSTLIKAKVS